jgi:hypothetical protein
MEEDSSFEDDKEYFEDQEALEDSCNSLRGDSALKIPSLRAMFSSSKSSSSVNQYKRKRNRKRKGHIVFT